MADEIPPDLQRIVEFLNAQMSPAEVLAIEIRQYIGHNFHADRHGDAARSGRAVGVQSS
ncbi:MAG TPA: hypothetical protein VGW38_27250 [Chloroflexota bacterium]|nr:hypothetical protein [Chloroflexota bacterium]